MKTEITLANCYYNNSLMNFFFRSQATETFNELLETVANSFVCLSQRKE